MKKGKTIKDVADLFLQKRFDEGLDILAEYPRVLERIDTKKVKGTSLEFAFDDTFLRMNMSEKQYQKECYLHTIKAEIEWADKDKSRNKFAYHLTPEEVDFGCGFLYNS